MTVRYYTWSMSHLVYLLNKSPQSNRKSDVDQDFRTAADAKAGPDIRGRENFPVALIKHTFDSPNVSGDEFIVIAEKLCKDGEWLDIERRGVSVWVESISERFILPAFEQSEPEPGPKPAPLPFEMPEGCTLKWRGEDDAEGFRAAAEVGDVVVWYVEPGNNYFYSGVVTEIESAFGRGLLDSDGAPVLPGSIGIDQITGNGDGEYFVLSKLEPAQPPPEPAPSAEEPKRWCVTVRTSALDKLDTRTFEVEGERPEMMEENVGFAGVKSGDDVIVIFNLINLIMVSVEEA